MDDLLSAVGAFGVSLASALTQVIPVEAYLAGLALLTEGAGIWLVAALAGLGHGLGKLAWYELGRGVHAWPRFQRWMERPAVAATYARWLAAFETRPRLTLLLLFASAVVSVPPLSVTPTIAGQLRVGRGRVLAIVTVGRTVRFAALLGAAEWLAELL